MAYKKLEKIRKEFESLDLSHYRILTLDEMLKVNGGTSYHVTTEKSDSSLSAFATGHFIAEGLVNDYKPCGTVDFIVDGTRVQSECFNPLTEPYIWDGVGKVLGEANFNYDFSNAGRN